MHGLTILRAHGGRRMTKRFALASNGRVVAEPYDNATFFSAERVVVNGIDDLHRLLRRLERDPHACVIRGEAVPGTDMARTRRTKLENGGAFAEVPGDVVMLDIDEGVPLPPGGSVLTEPVDAARVLLDRVAAAAPELEGISAVVQFSSSAGLDELAAGERTADSGDGARRDWSGVAKAGLRAHIWFKLREPLGEAELLRWRERVAAAGLPLDPATLRTVQPHYTAAPVFDAPLRDPLVGRRTVLVRGAEDAALLDVPPEGERPQRATGDDTGSTHAGRGYAAFLADIGSAEGFHGPVLRAAASFVSSNCPHPNLAVLKAELRAHILAADPGGRTRAEIADRASDRHLDGVIAWVLQREQTKRAAQAVAPPAPPVLPSFPDLGVPLGQAQGDMADALASYAARLRAGTAHDLLARVTVGGGKSEAAIRAVPTILAAAREATPDGALFYLAPRHELNEELRGRFADRHPGLRVRIWRGMDADDPERPGSKMCLDRELPDAAAAAGLPRTTPCAACPLACGYRSQGAQPAEVWLAAHPLAFGRKPAALPAAAALVIDESFHGAAIAGLDPLRPIELPLSDLLDERTGAVTGLDRQRLLFLRQRAFDAVRGHAEGGLLRDAFRAAGLTPDSAAEWQELEWAVKPRVDLGGGIGRDDILDRLREASSAGFRKLRPTLARYVRDLLAGEAARSVNVTVVPGGAALRFAWREDFAAWAADLPKLMLDATTHPDLVRVWAPAVEVVDVEVAAPHQRVRQVLQEFGRSFFVGKPQNVRRLADLVIVELALAAGEVLVVAQKAVLALLRKELARRFPDEVLPDRLHLAHHGAVTGMDRWRTVERALIVGRPALNRRAGERQAEIVRGAPVAVVADAADEHWPTVTGGIRLADGSGAPVRQPHHPDPLVEALRWSITEGAVIQALGRPRGVQRGAAAPVHVTVLASLALPVTVHEVATWEAVQPDRLEVAAAEATLTGLALPLAPADLHDARPDLWDTPKAAERFLAVRSAPGKTPKPLIGTPCKAFGGFSPLLPARYRKPGARRWSLALVPQEAPRAALVAVVGELAAFELAPLVPPSARRVSAPPPDVAQAPPAPPRPAALPAPLAADALAAGLLRGFRTFPLLAEEHSMHIIRNVRTADAPFVPGRPHNQPPARLHVVEGRLELMDAATFDAAMRARTGDALAAPPRRPPTAAQTNEANASFWSNGTAATPAPGAPDRPDANPAIVAMNERHRAFWANGGRKA